MDARVLNTNALQPRLKSSQRRLHQLYQKHLFSFSVQYIQKMSHSSQVDLVMSNIQLTIFFMMGNETQARSSCSINWRGEFFIFGGSLERRQISKLSGCKLHRLGSLSFNFYAGACTNLNDERIYLCFDANEIRRCRASTSPTGDYALVEESNFDHKTIRIASSEGKNVFQVINFNFF